MLIEKIKAIFVRKTTAIAGLGQLSPPLCTALSDNPLKFDSGETFSAIAPQVGDDNERLRNLLIDANSKIGNLEGQMQQKFNENGTLREEVKLLYEKLTAFNNSFQGLDSCHTDNRQSVPKVIEQRHAQQASVDEASRDASKQALKLRETEADLIAAKSRLRQIEGRFTEVSTLLARLETVRLKTKSHYKQVIIAQRLRHVALQARVSSTEQLLDESRENLLAAAEELSKFDRQFTGVVGERNALQALLSEMERERIQRNLEIKEVDREHATLMKCDVTLTRANKSKELAPGRAEQRNEALKTEIRFMSTQKLDQQKQPELQIKETGAALRRAKLERSVEEGALEILRLLRISNFAADLKPKVAPSRARLVTARALDSSGLTSPPRSQLENA